eukprot:TRINITY_DN619_c0_g1_i3.p1 TRINITY_DN619_c0_g1~~TRINITY_DN619_c0_g1_i3.p1  ORF type:complete len:104 (+),score=28.01 TRINITY_DN619_c0_g1_i3:237-548(+)
MSTKIKVAYSDRVPVIVERAPKSDVPEIDKNKFLAPSELKVEKFMEEIRKHIKLTPEKSLFIFVGKGTTLQPNRLMGEVYEKYKDEDGFLYITYSGENTFGSN